MSQLFGYGCLIVAEGVSFAFSLSNQTGPSAGAALLLGVLASAPTANHCAGRIFARLTRGS